MPRTTKEEIEEYDRCKTAYKIDYHNEFGKDTKLPNFETNEDEDMGSFQRKLDEELLGMPLQIYFGI